MALRFVGAASVTLSLVVSFAGCSRIKSALQPPTPSPSTPAPVRLSDAQQGALYQQQGIIAKQDYLHLVRVQDGINRAQTISDEDVAFIEQQLSARPVQDTSRNAVQAQDLILWHTHASAGHKPKRLTPAHQVRLYKAILPYTSSSDQGVQVDASLALATTRDPRAIKVLEHMAQSSPYSVVRLDAKTWLKRLTEVGVTAEQASQ